MTTVLLVAPLGVGGRHRFAVGAVEQTLEWGGSLSSAVCGATGPAPGQDGVGLVPQILIDDGLVFTGIPLLLVSDLTQVDAVVEDFVEGGLVERVARIYPAIAIAAAFGVKALFFEFQALSSFLETSGDTQLGHANLDISRIKKAKP